MSISPPALASLRTISGHLRVPSARLAASLVPPIPVSPHLPTSFPSASNLPRCPARGSRRQCPPCPLACRLPRTLHPSLSSPLLPAVGQPARAAVSKSCTPSPCPVPLGSIVLYTSPSLPPHLPALDWPASAVSAGCPPPLCPRYLGLTLLFGGLPFPSSVPLPLSFVLVLGPKKEHPLGPF